MHKSIDTGYRIVEIVTANHSPTHAHVLVLAHPKTYTEIVNPYYVYLKEGKKLIFALLYWHCSHFTFANKLGRERETCKRRKAALWHIKAFSQCAEKA